MPNLPTSSKANTVALSKYPCGNVMFTYMFLGGAVGGLIFDLGALIYYSVHWLSAPYLRPDMGVLIGTIMGALMIAVFAGVFGFPAALLTGIIIAIKKMVVASKRDYLKVGFIGASSSALVTLVFDLVIYVDEGIHNIKVIVFSVLMFAIIGGLSAVILAKFVLPKVKTIKD